MLALALTLVAARPLAVVPIAAAGMSSGEMQELPAVDEAIRTAAARDGIALQAREQTVAALQSARTAGVACAVADVACWKKVAVLSEVELMLVPVAAPRADGQLALVVTLVDVGAAKPARVIDAVPKGKDPDGKIKKLVDDAFARAAEPIEPDEATPTGPASDAVSPGVSSSSSAASPPSTSSSPSSSTSPSTSFDLATIPPWGLGAGAAGVGIVVGAAVGVVAALAVASGAPHKPQLAAPPAPPTSGPAVVQLP